MKKIKLSIREVLLISILAVAALIYVYLTYFLFPSYLRIGELNTELMLKKKVVAEMDEAQKLLNSLDSRMEKSKAQMEKMEKKIPYNIRLPELVVNIDSKISSLGIDIKSIYIGDPDTANAEYDIVPVSVSMEGNYDNIMAFINYIENNNRKFIIDSFALAPLKRAEDMPFDISMRTFVLKDAQKSPVPEPTDYYFFRHNNGKGYPFLENGKAPTKQEEDLFEDIEAMQKNFEQLEDIKLKVEKMLPN